MNNIKVSILCLSYNHEKYIRDALEGFVNQKTNFEYEVLINDDCSTDNTANIIREYEKKYPKIIKPIYQSCNQYSKGVDIFEKYFYPRAKGEYFALCEGDDFWCDINKLQIQYDYMESHSNCYLCTHTYNVYNCKKNRDSIICRSKEDRDFTLKEIVDGNGELFATNSLFMKREVLTGMPACFNSKLFGDYQIPIYAAILGKVHYINRNMSTYRYISNGSWSSKIINNINKLIEIKRSILQVLERTNAYYKEAYNDDFYEKIQLIKIDIMFWNEEYKTIRSNDFYKHNKDKFSFKRKFLVNIGCISKTLVRIIKWIFGLK